MPRSGDGSSDNGPFEADNHVIHGAGNVQTSKVDRADKTAPLPEGMNEKGAGLDNMNASGGQSQGLKMGDEVGQGGGSQNPSKNQ